MRIRRFPRDRWTDAKGRRHRLQRIGDILCDFVLIPEDEEYRIRQQQIAGTEEQERQRKRKRDKKRRK